MATSRPIVLQQRVGKAHLGDNISQGESLLPQPQNNSHLAFSSKLKNHLRLKADSIHSRTSKQEIPLYNSLTARKHQPQEQPPHEKHSSENQLFSKSLAQFDKLCLDEFLKVVIVGEKKVSDKKSSEIIRSLNGTWFKDMNTDQVRVKQMVNTLGIRRGRQSARIHYDPPLSYETPEEPDNNRLLFQLCQYRPPNLFPRRNSTSAKRMLGQRPLLESKMERNTRNEGSLKNTILSQFERKSSQRTKRSSVEGEKRLKPLTNSKICSADNQHIVKGVRMMLHE